MGQNYSTIRGCCPPSPLQRRQTTFETSSSTPQRTDHPGNNSPKRLEASQKERVADSASDTSDVFALAERKRKSPHKQGVSTVVSNSAEGSTKKKAKDPKVYFQSVFREMVSKHKEVKSETSRIISELRARNDDIISQQAACTLEDVFDESVKKTARKRMANISDTSSFLSISQEEKHLARFDHGSHVFISKFAFDKIFNFSNDPAGWNCFGIDKNFVGTLGDADEILSRSMSGTEDDYGISLIEKEFGIPHGQWAKDADGSIFRFKINSPRDFGLSIPNGSESGAYQNEWISGGYTLGVQPEATINAMSREQLIEEVRTGRIEIEKVTFNADRTTTVEPVTFE